MVEALTFSELRSRGLGYNHLYDNYRMKENLECHKKRMKTILPRIDNRPPFTVKIYNNLSS